MTTPAPTTDYPIIVIIEEVGKGVGMGWKSGMRQKKDNNERRGGGRDREEGGERGDRGERTSSSMNGKT